MSSGLRVYVSATMHCINQLQETALPLEQLSIESLSEGVPKLLPLDHLFSGRPMRSVVATSMKTLIARADVLYVWVEDSADFMQGLEVGYAYAVGTPIVVGAPSGHLLGPFSNIARSQGVASGIRTSYNGLMADADMFKRDFWEQQTTLLEVTCIACSGKCAPRSAVYMNREGEVCHRDCYVRYAEKNGLHEAVFNSELVAALRVENAKLQQDYDALHEEYLKWVHP